jgi:superfamily II DNA/RNA helicase
MLFSTPGADTTEDFANSPSSGPNALPALPNRFAALGLNANLLRAIEATGYTEPTPVQEQAIPVALAGSDVLVSSQTGSGKTAAFMLPALHRLSAGQAAAGTGPRLLILTPTRELALQVTKAAEVYGKFLRRIKTVAILGGMPYPVQNRLLRQGIDVLVATPGRLLDHLQRGRIDFSRLEMLVLDEADRMLDMGFIDDIETIVAATPATRQTLLFSATLDGTVGKLAAKMTRSPKRIEISSAHARHENIEQRLHFADDLSHKNKLLQFLLRDASINQAVVFTATKRDADTLAHSLVASGFAAAALHGDMRQGERNRTLNAVRSGGVKVLVATDVAARGIDVLGISHVINFDLPRQAEDYVHRIGRTGRAGRQGVAISLASGKDIGAIRQIERYTAHPIPVHTIAGLEPRFAGRAPAKKPAGRRPGSPRSTSYSTRNRTAPRRSA